MSPNSIGGNLARTNVGPAGAPGGFALAFARPMSPSGSRPTPAGAPTVSQGPPVVVAPSGSYVGPLADKQPLGEPFAVFVGMLTLWFLLGWFSNNPETLGGANPAFLKIGGYNFFAVGLTSVIFILALKIIANKTQFPGILEFANAI